MFKHVEEMRRTALRVMYTTYGYKKKDTAAIQDQYPLVSLVRLLCFEDIDEARSACQHYNITTKDVELASNSSPTGKKRMELILWKASRFTIPKDDVKGVVIPLKPRKMLRTIESKLNGVTRLAVCRGEASGEGSALTQVPPRRVAIPVPAFPLSAEDQAIELEKQRAAAAQQEELRRREAEWKQKEEEERRQKMELKRKLEEKKRSAEMARLAAEEEKTRVAREKQLEMDNARKRAEAEEQRRREEREKKEEAEKVRQKAEADAEEQRRLMAEAELKKKAQEEEVRRQAEALARAEEQQRALRAKREEEERRRKIVDEENAKKRHAEERFRIKRLQEQVEKERKEKSRRADEEARQRAEKEAVVNAAKKLLLWRRIRHNLAPLVQRSRTEQSLRRIDPTFSSISDTPCIQQFAADYRVQDLTECYDDPDELTLADFLEEVIQWKSDTSQIADILDKTVRALENMIPTPPRAYSSSVHNVTLACIVPKFEGVQAETAHELLHKWMDSRFRYDVEQSFTSGFSDIRFTAVNGNKITQVDQADFALLVIPPFMNDARFTNTALTSCMLLGNDNIPVVALNLEDGVDGEYKSFLKNALTTCSVKRMVETPGDETYDFETALGAAFFEIMRLFLQVEERKRQNDAIRLAERAEQRRLEGQRLVAVAARKNAEEEDKARIFLQKQLDLETARNKADDEERCWRLEMDRNTATEAARPTERVELRSRTPILNDEFEPSKKRFYEVGTETPMKRGREETDRERESKAFTARLEAIMKGDVVIDTVVGESTLRQILATVPAIREIPDIEHRRR